MVWISIVLFMFQFETIAAQETTKSGQNDLRVMSFNIRYGSAKDGDNHWEKRKQNVVATIASYKPDILGTQETLKFQAEFLKSGLEEYSYFGRSREDNNTGEQCGLLVLTKRFDVLEQGHFWLSETPNVPGSKSWDSSLPRMASWLKLFDRQNRRPLYVVNTHFDHRGKVAREESAKVIVARTKRFESGVPVVVTGDFNTGPASRPYQSLAASFTDTFASLHPNAVNSGTFGGFVGKTSGARIDFVFVSSEVKVVQANIDRREFDGRNPSDHFPVTSVLRLKD